MDDYNFTSLCGTSHLEIWNAHDHKLGMCFQKLFLITPVFALFAITSAFFIGKQSEYVLRGSNDLAILYCRAAVVVAMVLFSVLVEPLTLVLQADARIYWVDAVAFGVQVIIVIKIIKLYR